MVLFKRKPVQFLPLADIPDDNVEVWHIKETGEIFVSYEDYLNRMDFYKQRRFNDQITGQSGMTFFEAHKSETHGGKEVEETFPEALKGPVLHKVQFQIVSRLDSLVDLLFDQFKADYYPGEEITVALEGGEKAVGLVRDKTAFGPKILADGKKCRPTTRYLVEIKEDGREMSVTDEHIYRERGSFTKAMLRSFLKRTTFREAWNGAPWLVKAEYANLFHIDSRVPSHLQWATVKEERRQLQAARRAGHSQEVNGNSSNTSNHTHNISSSNSNSLMRLPELKPAPKGHKNKHALPIDEPPPPKEETPPPPPPPPPKYPIDDLLLEHRPDAVRPPLQYMCIDPPVKVKAENHHDAPIRMESVGPLLETWDTLNVYCEIFTLDSFTFDDFVEAMVIASDQEPVQLYDEIHCSVLKILVDAEADGGKVRITLPELDEDGSDEEEEEEEEEIEETPEPQPKPTGRATRSSMAKLEAERLAAEAAAAEEEEVRKENETKHRAEELLAEYNWIEELRKRNFANGGWEMIIVGLLHQLSKKPEKTEVCEDILLQLVPPLLEPSQERVRQAYGELDVNYRVKILQMICMLTMETQSIRGYLEECSETMTKYRKEKIEWQRMRKVAVEELRQLNEQRKILLPDNLPPSPPAEEVKEIGDDTKMTDSDETLVVDKATDSGSENDTTQKKKKQRRRVQVEKQKKQEEEAKEKEKQKALKAVPKHQSKEFMKLLKQIAEKEKAIKKCEDEVAVIDNDLREADCPRTRVLGKDRFWNRYYWFERNGMPYGGLPTSSTAAADYANGCIWVQGPDDLEREGYIDMSGPLQDEYRASFGMTVPERKAVEEGGTSVFTAYQWGYIAEPTQVDELIRWLDTRGHNEMKLRKELVTFRDKIMTHMEKRKVYLGLMDANGNDNGHTGSASADDDEDSRDKKDEAKRSSTRIRDRTPEVPVRRCLSWVNTMALEEKGHLHSEPPPPPRARKQTKKREAMSEAGPAPAAKSRRR